MYVPASRSATTNFVDKYREMIYCPATQSAEVNEQLTQHYNCTQQQQVTYDMTLQYGFRSQSFLVSHRK